ncbi:MAG: nitroreductase family protein [Thomasclavelia sp.]
MTTIETIKSRRSPEKFNSQSINEQDIATIIETGNYAPIFGNIHFTVIENKELIKIIDSITIEMMKQSNNEFAVKMANTKGYSATRNAPVAIVLSALNGNDPQGFNMANVSLASENMILTATELKISSRFVMGPVLALNQEPVKSKINLPEGYVPLVMILLGYSDNDFKQRNKDIKNINYIKD